MGAVEHTYGQRIRMYILYICIYSYGDWLLSGGMCQHSEAAAAATGKTISRSQPLGADLCFSISDLWLFNSSIARLFAFFHIAHSREIYFGCVFVNFAPISSCVESVSVGLCSARLKIPQVNKVFNRACCQSDSALKHWLIDLSISEFQLIRGTWYWES